jgi:predicted nucleic acid-binding protein
MTELEGHGQNAHDSQILVDTPVWSLSLRRRSSNLNPAEMVISEHLAHLVRSGNVRVVGPVRQEVLSGIRDEIVFKRIRGFLRSFDEPRLEIADYELAAQMHNRCSSRGVAGTAVDLLICAVANRRAWSIFTLDHDFERYRKVLGIALYAAP